MTSRPIIFSAPMIRALLAGTKTQTRRVAVSGTWGSCTREYVDHADFDRAYVDGSANDQYLHVPCHARANGECRVCDRSGWTETVHRLWPRYRVGDALWVRETVCVMGDTVIYAADWSDADLRESATMRRRYPELAAAYPDCRWRPSIHMPRTASRITLRVTSVRVERLQDISDADVEAEGLPPGAWYRVPGARVHWYRTLWDSLNAARAPWASNPWVWTIAFERVQP